MGSELVLKEILDYSASDYFYIGDSQDINNGIDNTRHNYGGYTFRYSNLSAANSDANGYGDF